MFRALLALDVDRSDPPAPGLRTLLHGGEPCPASIKQAMLDWFGPCLVEYYGFTEGGLTVADSADWCQRPGTVGRPPPGQEILILDKDGTVLGPHQTGLICFRAVDGGRRFRYLHDSAKTMAAYIGDAYTVGDLGWVDDDGYLFVSGRSDDVVICAGVNIYPAEIEAALADVPGVADLAAVGGPDDERGEHVVLLYTCTEGVDPLTVRADLARQAEVRLAGYKRPREVRLVDEIPRDGTGKLLRRALRSKLTRS
jgi:acyl-coenzyme A synthetase/AMP-(fatty) acid ligase